MEEKIKVSILPLGKTSVDISNVFPPEKKPLWPLAWTGLFRPKKYQYVIPVTSYLIEHPKGRIVFDTGFHSLVRTDPLKELTFIHNTINKPLQEEGSAIDEVLAARGIRPEDIDYVVLSHLHSDHASGMRLLKGAKHIVTSDEEWAAAQKPSPSYLKRWWQGIDVETFKLTDCGVGPVGKAWDVFGDHTIEFFKLPGHTPGMVGARIMNNGKYLLLAADCGYGRRSWEEMIVPSVISDREAFESSLRWLRERSKDPNCIDVLANHETDLNTYEYEI